MGEPQQRASAPYALDQKNPAFRKALKRMIERGIPRSIAREAARISTRKPKLRTERRDAAEDE